MAVIQISKIQHRRGAIGEQGMPQLASGELGWAVDTQQLFIGNGSVAEGAPAVGNTEVLTQYSTATINLFKFIYEYQGGKVDTTTFQPQAVERTLQQKLDDIVSVKDFGAVGDGIADDRRAIQTAISATYINSHDPGTDLSYRKILHFPAGTYNVSGVIYLPPNIYIQGEGANRSVVVATTTGSSTIFRTRSVNTETGNAYDFLQPLTAASDIVNNVVIDNLGFTYASNVLIYNTTTNTNALLNLDMTTNSVVKNCEFHGRYLGTGTVINPAHPLINPVHHAGIQITGKLTKNLLIDTNNFSNLIMGCFTYQDNRFVDYINNRFTTLWRGLHIGDFVASAVNQISSVGNRATGNTFRDINRQGIFVQSPASPTTSTSFLSEGNIFDNVGNGATGETNQIYECINFGNTKGSVSVNDTFTRVSLSQQTAYRTSKLIPVVTGTSVLIDDKTAYKYTISWATATNLIRIPYANKLTSVTMEYQLQKSSGFRKGTFLVSAPPIGQGTVTYKDDFNYSGTDPKVVLTAITTSSTGVGTPDCIAIRYLNDQTIAGNTGTGTISLTLKYQT
jgi:hypothetical protein